MARASKQEVIDAQEEYIQRLTQKNTDLTIELLAQQAETRQSREIKELTGLISWVAIYSEGTPVCVGGDDSDNVEDHIAVSIYHKNGRISGVILSDGLGTPTSMYGQIPAEVMKEELYLARRTDA